MPLIFEQKFTLRRQKFFELTGVPAVLNTSFNDRGEPIVMTPQDAMRCYSSTGLDHLALGDFLISKESQG